MVELPKFQGLVLWVVRALRLKLPRQQPGASSATHASVPGGGGDRACFTTAAALWRRRRLAPPPQLLGRAACANVAAMGRAR